MGRTGSKQNTVVNRGRVRHVTFGTGEKVVDSAGVVRVKVSYKMQLPVGSFYSQL